MQQVILLHFYIHQIQNYNYQKNFLMIQYLIIFLMLIKQEKYHQQNHLILLILYLFQQI